MKIPTLDDPSRYVGLFVVDFGGSVAVGYTGSEVAILLENEAYRHIKIYRIHRAGSDGTIEMVGVHHDRFAAEDGFFFFRNEEADARADFQELKARTADRPPPAKATLQRARLEGSGPPHVTALIFPGELSQQMARWLAAIGFRGGDHVEYGISVVTDYNQRRRVVIEQHQASGTIEASSRSAGEVLSSTHLAIQR